METTKPCALPDPAPTPADPVQEALRRAIKAAPDLATLQQAALAIQVLAQRLVEQELGAEQLTRMISSLNDALTRRVIDLCSTQLQADDLEWCWISLGSEGRQEQTLSGDQDNGIIFTSHEHTPDQVRALLLPLARRINEALDACGFPLCLGEIMASNPRWCLSLGEWRERFGSWVIEGDPQALLNASIFFDLRPLHGARHLAHQLNAWLALEAAENSRFLFQMAANALRREPPLGLLRRFVVASDGPHAGTIDLKLNGAALFVDAARIYSLACGAGASNTADRLRLACAAQRLHPDDVARWIDAFHVIQMLRMRNQHQHYAGQAMMHNHVDPKRLEPADRHALQQALRQARVLQQRLALDYPGSRQGM
jgi:CBS domain-containing protein